MFVINWDLELLKSNFDSLYCSYCACQMLLSALEWRWSNCVNKAIIYTCNSVFSFSSLHPKLSCRHGPANMILRKHRSDLLWKTCVQFKLKIYFTRNLHEANKIRKCIMEGLLYQSSCFTSDLLNGLRLNLYIYFFNLHNGGGSPSWVPSARRPLNGLLYLPRPGWLWWWRNWWNEDWQGKPNYSEKTCPSATLSTTNPTWPDPGANPGRRGGKPATNRLSLNLYKKYN
jgi:hypothetical protein